MKLFVGLGNPGSKYEKTRHNAGFMAVDALSKEWNIDLTEDKKFKGFIGRGVVKGEKVILLKPTTYMNLSGESVKFFKNVKSIKYFTSSGKSPKRSINSSIMSLYLVSSVTFLIFW